MKEINRRERSNGLTDIFDQAYGLLMHGNSIALVVKNNKVACEVPFNDIEDLSVSNVNSYMNKFEKYVAEKYNFKPIRLEVENTNRKWYYIVYGTSYVDCVIATSGSFFPGYDSLNTFKIKTNMPVDKNDNIKLGKNRHKMLVRSIDMPNETGALVNNCFCGVFIYDSADKEAVKNTYSNSSKLADYVEKIRQRGEAYIQN